MIRTLRSQSGVGLVGALLALVVLGGVAAVVVAEVGGPAPPVHLANPLTGSSPQAGAAGAGADVQAARVATCRSDYEAASQAADIYTAEHGHPPTSMSDLSGLLRDPASGPGFTLGVDPSGRITVATPGHPASPGPANCATAGS